jgi:hypothetical protein
MERIKPAATIYLRSAYASKYINTHNHPTNLQHTPSDSRLRNTSPLAF